MRIVHVSDLHIRNFKFRDEYRAGFSDLYEQLDRLSPDLVINTGDTVHSKLSVSPELFDEVADHLQQVAKIAPYWLILGNHDLNLRNRTRTDAISPIVRALHGKTRHEIILMDDRSNSILGPNDPFWWETAGDAAAKNFWHYDIRGNADPTQFKIDPKKINIGLYHGSVSGCTTDLGFTMEHGEVDLSHFTGMDYVLLGDIHKRQAFQGGRVQYAGSLIQQNYGEELEKGFLLWDIRSKEDFEVTFHRVKSPGRFYSIQVPASLDLTGVQVPRKSRIKVLVEGELTPSKRVELERRIRETFDPLEVITPDPTADKRRLDELTIERLVGSREQMIRDHLEEIGASEERVESVLQLWNKYLGQIEDAQARGTTWSLRNFSWDNFMNYGEGNHLDLQNLRGLVGVFAPNASGKSTIFDVLLEGIFDKISKDAPRNIDLINDNRDKARITVEFESQGKPYLIEREIERITYGQRKLPETKQWGKMTLDLSSEGDSLNGDSRPETERVIRSIVGSFDDFVLTAMVTQNPTFGLPGGGDIINCKETDRKKILYRFLDLDVFERVHQAAKDDLKQHLGSLKKGDEEQLLSEHKQTQVQLAQSKHEDSLLRRKISDLTSELEEVRRQVSASDKTSTLVREIGQLEKESLGLQKELTLKESRLSEALEELGRAGADLERHDRSCPKVPEIGIEDLAAKIEELREKQLRVGRQITEKNLRIGKGNDSLKVLEEVPCGGTFPTCRFIADAVLFKTERSLLEQALHELRAEHDRHEAQLDILREYEVKHREHTAWQTKRMNLIMARDVAQVKVKSAESDLKATAEAADSVLKRLDDARAKLDAVNAAAIEILVGRAQVLQEEIESLNEKLEMVIRAQGAFEARLKEQALELDRLKQVTQKVTELELLVDMTGKNGLPLRILSLVLPVVNMEIEKILGGVVKFSVFFEHDPEDQTVSLFIRYGDYKSRPLALGSGAEKFIASLAIRGALLCVSSLPKTDILIIDEGFGKLDPEHLESLQRMFEYLREAFKTVFLVSHVDSMRDMVDHSLDITSLDGYAHVEA